MLISKRITIGNALDPAQCIELVVPAEFSASKVMEALKSQLEESLRRNGQAVQGELNGMSTEPAAFCLAVAAAANFESMERRLAAMEKRTRAIEDELEDRAAGEDT